MTGLDNMGPGELESVLDEVHSRLARRYGKSEAEIAKLAVKKYGGSKTMSETDELLLKLNSMLNAGKQDVTDKMLTMEMIRDLRADRERQPPPQYQQQPPPQQLQQNPVQEGTMPSFEKMMYMMMMPQMIKAMAKSGGDDNFLETMYKYKMMMGEDGKGVDMVKLEQMILEERAHTSAQMEQMMNTLVGKQEAEKLREKEERYRREMEQRLQNAEYMARHPATPQDPYQATKQRIDEAMDMVVDNKRRMEDLGMVERPQSLEDKEFTKDMAHLKHQQGIETQAISKGLEHVGKGVDNLHELAKQGVDMLSEEQKVRKRQLDMASPEERKRLQQQYEALGAEVMEEQEIEGTMEPEEPEEDAEFSDADDLDTTD